MSASRSIPILLLLVLMAGLILVIDDDQNLQGDANDDRSVDQIEGGDRYTLYQDNKKETIISEYELRITGETRYEVSVSKGQRVEIGEPDSKITITSLQITSDQDDWKGANLIFRGPVEIETAKALPDSIITIEFQQNAKLNKTIFKNCSKLQSIVAKSDVEAGTTLSFSGATNLECLKFQGKVQLPAFKTLFKTDGDLTIILEGKSELSGNLGGVKGELQIQIGSEATLPFNFSKNAEYVLSPGANLILKEGWKTGYETTIRVDQLQNSETASIELLNETGDSKSVDVSNGLHFVINLNSYNQTLNFFEFKEKNTEGMKGQRFANYDLTYIDENGEGIEQIYGTTEGPKSDGDVLLRYLGKEADFTMKSNATSISDGAFRGLTTLKRLTFSDGLQTIGALAFEGCTNLESAGNAAFMGGDSGGLRIPDSVTSIGKGAFFGCEKLSSVVLGSGLATLEDSAFRGCKGLERVEFGSAIKTIGDNAFYSCVALSKFSLPTGLISIGEYAFNGCIGIKELEFPETLTNIGKRAFFSCTGLEEIDFSEGLLTIGDSAFALNNGEQGSIRALQLPNSLEQLGKMAFQGRNHLETVRIGQNLAGASRILTIGDEPFGGCSDLQKISLSTATLTSVGSGFPGGSTCYPELEQYGSYVEGQVYKIENNVLKHLENGVWKSVSPESTVDRSGETITQIKGNEYWNNRVLEVITLPSTVSSIQKEAFYGCVNLKRVQIVWSQEHAGISIGENAFYGCRSLESIVYIGGTDQEAVTIIGLAEGAFRDCSNFATEGVNLGSSITEIPKNCFRDSGLRGITLPAGLTKIGEMAFSGTEITDIHLPKGVELALGTQQVKMYGVGENVYKITTPFTNCAELTSISLESGSRYTFQQGCLTLKGKILWMPENTKELTISGSNVDFINSYDGKKIAFFANNTKLERIDLTGSEISALPDMLFYKCSALSEVKLPQSLTQIGDYVFTYDRNLTALSFEGGTKLTSIGEMAFSQTGLANVNIPSSENGEIKKNAFYASQNLATVSVGLGWSIGEYAFGHIRSAVTISFTESPIAIAENAFYGTTSLQAIHIGSGTRYTTDKENLMLFEQVVNDQGEVLGKKILIVASSVDKIQIPKDVIGYSSVAFANNLILKEITVEEGSTGYRAVNGMLLKENQLVLVPHAMDKVEIPEEVESVSSEAFMIIKSGDQEFKQYVSEFLWGSGETTKDLDFYVKSVMKAQIMTLKLETKGTIYLHGTSSSLDIPYIEFKGGSVKDAEDSGSNARLNFGTSTESLVISDSSFDMQDRFKGRQYVLFDIRLGDECKDPLKAIERVTGCQIGFEGLEITPEFYAMSLARSSGDDSSPAMLMLSATSVSGLISQNMVLKVNGKEIGLKSGMYTVELSEQTKTVLTFSEKSDLAKHKVTFDFGESATEVAEIPDGQCVPDAILRAMDSSSHAQRAGYSLYGWYVDKEFKYAYSSGAITEDRALYAKWTLDEGVEVQFGSDDTIRAMVNGEYLFSGEKVEKGTKVTFIFCGSGKELKDWIVNGRAVGSSDGSIERTIQSRTEVEVDTRAVSAYGDGLTGIDAPFEDIKKLWAFRNNIDTSMNIWSGFPSIPLVVDDSVYFRAGDTLYRVDSFTGEILNSVYEEDSTIVAYYIYVGYGDGIILDYATHTAYDLELKPQWTFPEQVNSAFYGEDNYFYGIADGKLVKFSSDDGKVVDGWSVDVSGWHTLYGTTARPVVLDGMAYYVYVSGDDRGIGCIDLEHGTSPEPLILQYANGMLLDDGWLTTAEIDGTDYLFLTAYGVGLFNDGNSSTGARLFSIKLKQDGGFESDSERFMQFVSSGCASAFVVYKNRGYLNINGHETGDWGTLYTIDVEKFLKGVYGSEWDIYKGSSEKCYQDFLIYMQDSTYTHGSIVVDTAQYESTGSVYIYMLPYNPCGTMILIFEDHAGKVRDTGHTEIKGSNAFGSQTVRIGANGVLVWYDDSGTVYCYASASKVPYRFLLQDKDGAEWVSQQGTDVEDALKKALEAKGWDSDISKLNIWFKNQGDYYEAKDLTDRTVSGFREFLVSTDIDDINEIPERTFYQYKTDGAAESYSILTLFDDHTVKGRLTVSGFSKILVHDGKTVEWIGVDGNGTLKAQIENAIKKAGVSFQGYTMNVFECIDGSWQPVKDTAVAIEPDRNYFVSVKVDNLTNLPSGSYYRADESGKVLIKTLEDLMSNSDLVGQYTTKPVYAVEYDLKGGTDSSKFTAAMAVESGEKFEVPGLETINAKVTRNNYVILALLVDGKDVSGQEITVTADTVIEISWGWAKEDERVADVELSADGATSYLIYEGSGYGKYANGAKSGINSISDRDLTDVADKTMFVVFSQKGTPSEGIVGNLYCDGTLIYSENLENTNRVWYVTIGDGPNSSGSKVLSSLVGNSTKFVMEIKIGDLIAVRTTIDTSLCSDDGWISGVPEIRGYYGFGSDGTIAEGSSVTLEPVFYIQKDGEIKESEDVAQTKVYWSSSNESVAKISDGKVTAVSKGTAVITCVTEDGGHTVSCTIQVSAAPIKNPKIAWSDGESRGLNPGQTGSLVITCDSGAAAKVQWSSSDESVVFVDSDGNVKALSGGTAVITAIVQDNAGSDPVTLKMDIEVSNRLVDSVVLSDDDKSVALKPGENRTLGKPTIGPTDATDPTYTWSVSRGSSVTVDRNGTITAVSVGESTVRVMANDGSGIYDECIVTVEPVKVTSITLSSSTLALEVNGKAQLKATLGPKEATDLSVVWSVSGSCVTVDQDGNVSAVSEGKATITVTAADGSGQKATCVVTVTDYAVKSIDMSSSLKLEVGKTSTLTATVTPSYAKNKTITWSSSNPAVATVASGVVTAVSAGTAVITATSAGTSGITATCVVTVTDSLSKVQSVSIDSTTLSLDVGAKATVKATVSPEVSGVEYVWSVGEGTGSVSIQKNSDGSATVTAKTSGTVSLIVTVKGTEVSASCEITIVSKETKKVSEDTKTNDDGTSTTTTVEKIDTGKGSSTTKTTEVVKDSAGNVQGTEIVYEFKSDDSSIKTVTTVTIAQDGDGNAGDPKVEVDMGTKGSASNGTRSITVNSDQLKEALRQIECAKAVTGIDELDKKIEIRADEGKDVDAMTTTLDAASISSMSSSGGATLSISSEMGRMEIGTGVFSTMESMGGKAMISVKKADDTATVPEKLSEIGQKSLFEVDLVVGGKSVHDLNGSVTLSLPFALSDGQDPKKVGVRYVDADGNLSAETFRASYADGMVSFTTTHFSTFAVVYGDVVTDSEDGRTTTVTSGGDSTMTALCIVLAALTGAFAATTVMFVLRGKGRI